MTAENNEQSFEEQAAKHFRNLNIYQMWKNSGFIHKEAHELTYGHGDVNVDAEAVYNSKTGQATRQSRIDWIKTLRARDWTREQIIREVEAYYTRDKKRYPWDFIQAD